MLNRKNNLLIAGVCALLLGCRTVTPQQEKGGSLRIADNPHFFADGKGDPFFWLGDTGWLLFTKLNREEAAQYLEDRKQKGFNVIQVMVLHTLGAVNVYGDSALVNKDVTRPLTTPGNSFSDSLQYDFWDHVDYVVDKAAEKGLLMALVPVWGTNIKKGGVNQAQAKTYASFLASRYKHKPNIIWLNGGDISGGDSTRVWQTIGSTLHTMDSVHLVSFHPRGRTQSSDWFRQEPWMDFNMFQSGHRRYEQDTAQDGHRYGEDNWRYVATDYGQTPVKPTLDGEPSYENIPQGLHDTLQPYWKAADVRRYGYWSVFAGAAGFTYGDNAVMQFFGPKDKNSAYGAKAFWFTAINDTAAGQMIWLKKLMLSRPYFSREPAPALVDRQGSRYDYLAATKGKGYAMVYTCNGRVIPVHLEQLGGKKTKASWYSPRDGSSKDAGIYDNKGLQVFDPPGEQQNGNDWVLLLDEQ
jgi:hypothetical protein